MPNYDRHFPLAADPGAGSYVSSLYCAAYSRSGIAAEVFRVGKGNLCATRGRLLEGLLLGLANQFFATSAREQLLGDQPARSRHACCDQPHVLAASFPRNGVHFTTAARINRSVSLKELAAYSGLSVRTLRGRLLDPIRPMPHYRIGGKILVRRREFDGWVQQFRVTSVPTGIEAIVDDVVANLR